MTPRGLSYKAFNLPSHPDHKYIWFKGATPKPYIFMIRVTRQIKSLIAQAPGGHTPPHT
jgi:hypothetical protein